MTEPLLLVLHPTLPSSTANEPGSCFTFRRKLLRTPSCTPPTHPRRAQPSNSPTTTNNNSNNVRSAKVSLNRTNATNAAEANPNPNMTANQPHNFTSQTAPTQSTSC